VRKNCFQTYQQVSRVAESMTRSALNCKEPNSPKLSALLSSPIKTAPGWTPHSTGPASSRASNGFPAAGFLSRKTSCPSSYASSAYWQPLMQQQSLAFLWTLATQGSSTSASASGWPPWPRNSLFRSRYYLDQPDPCCCTLMPSQTSISGQG